MRKFTLFASSLLLSISAAASPVVMSAQAHRSTTLLGKGEPSAAEKSQIEKLRHAGHALQKASQTSGRSQANALRRAPGAAVAAKLPLPTNEIISETPEGTLSDWSRNCMGYYDFFGYIVMEEVKGCVQQMVDAGDAVYLNIVTSQFPLDSWVKGEKDADGNITIPAGQLVYKEYYEDEVYDFCMVPVTYAFEEDGDGEEVLQFYYHDSMKLNLVDGKYVADNPDMIMGLCEYYDEIQSYYWTGYGDSNLSLSPVEDTPMEMPSDLAAEKWAALTDDGGYFVQVALDGSKVYVKGLIYSNPDACMTGEISPDGKTVTFSGGQFLGASLDWTWSYVYGGELEEIWDDYWEEYVYEVYPTGDLVFDYDAEARRMVCKSAVAVCANASDEISEVEAVSYLSSFTLELQHRNPDAVPADPDQVSFYEEFESYGSNTLYFNIPEVDVDGNLLEPSMLYYRMYVDGDVFTFYDDEYLGVDEDGQELLPASFTNFDSIYSSGTYKCIYLFFQGADEVGVQSVYMQPTDGGETKELCSGIVTVSTVGVSDAVADREVKSSVYYDLQGRQVLNPTSGFYVRRDVMTDGSTAISKVVLR